MGSLLAWRGGNVAIGSLWVAGAVMAVAYAIGFIVLIQRSLQVGPVGPTVAINNSAMVCAVMAGFLWLDPRIPGAAVVAGIVGTLAGVALIAVGTGSPQEGAARAANTRWLKLVIPGGLFSGISFTTQAYAGLRHPGMDASLLFGTVVFGLSAVILAALLARQPRECIADRRVLTGGIVVGVMNGILLPLSLPLVKTLGAEVVFPLTIALPMVLVTLLARGWFRERISGRAWAGCLLTAVALAVLCWGTNRPAL
jgi:drug/metabolite transporter (DMT)-like permease